MSRVLEQIFVQLNKNAALLSVTDAGKDLELLALMANPTKKFISSLAFQDRSIIFAAQEIMLIKLRELGQRLAYNRYVTASEQKIYDFTTVLFERISAKLDQTYKDLKLPIKTRDPIPKGYYLSHIYIFPPILSRRINKPSQLLPSRAIESFAVALFTLTLLALFYFCLMLTSLCI
ncbi:hypothetical protein BY996DRAFT_7049261 [Phakopsora pachyrhizi]|nr:hypothetical protein BY996DRAFT_7049261 [Phakopsora pachyrhizi]